MAVLASLAFAGEAWAGVTVTDEHAGQSFDFLPYVDTPYQCAAPCALTFTRVGGCGGGGADIRWTITDENGNVLYTRSDFASVPWDYDFPNLGSYTVTEGETVPQFPSGTCATGARFRLQVLDKTPPDTTITSGPPAVTDNPTPTFTFSASESGSTFTCRFDDQPSGPCNSPVTALTLADGDHTFAVWATDAAGNTDPTPATVGFRVQRPVAAAPSAPPGSTPPQISVTVGAQSLAHVLQHGLKTKVGCSEACTLDSSLLATASERRRLKLAATMPLARTTAALTDAGRRALTLKLTARARRALHGLSKATLTLSVRATDTAGNHRIRNVAVHLRD